MDRRPLGRTGLSVPAVGFGCGNVGGLMVRGEADEQRRVVARALDAGMDYFDTAAQYGEGRSEENLGRALRANGAVNRATVGTKVRLGSDDIREPAPALRRALEAGLRRLGRDAVDVLHLHNPLAAADDEGSGRGAVPVDEALGAVADGLRRLVDAGLTRHVGMTGLGATPALLRAVGSGAFETMQLYVNLLNPSAVFPGASGSAQDFAGVGLQAAASGMGAVAIRVMAAGAVAGPAPRPSVASPAGSALTAGGAYDRDMERLEALRGLPAELGLDGMPELALRFVLALPPVSIALVGFSDLGQLEGALRWAERGPLPANAVERVVAVARGA